MPEAPLAGRTLMVIVAHPDDESLACGATMARAAALGVAVHAVTLTRGEAGPGARHAAPAATTTDALAGRRAREFADAAAVLGVARASAADHPDGMLPWVDADSLVTAIGAAIAEARPDVVITFGADGLYWHPDHIAVHERTTEAVRRLDVDAPALYYVTMPPGQMRRVAAADPAGRPVVPGLPDAEAFGAAADAPTLVVPCGPFAATKLAAIRRHASQFDASAFAALTDDDAGRLLDVEHFHRAAVGRAGPTFLDTLAATALPSDRGPAR